MVWALGLAATQSAGLREMFGSMGKAFHPGRSAQNGYAAALLAQAGFTSGERGIEGPRGFAARAWPPQRDLSKIPTRLGVDFDLRENTYKPFPCGIVNHPTIDGAIQIHDAARDRIPPSIVAVRLARGAARSRSVQSAEHHQGPAGQVLRLSRRGRRTRARQGRPARVHRRGGERSAIKRVRELTTATGDPSITEDQAHVEVELSDGRRLSKFVEQSLGNIHRPLTDKQLEEKFRDQAVLVLPPTRSRRSFSCAGKSISSTMSVRWWPSHRARRRGVAS